MAGGMSVGDILEVVRRRRRRKQCPDCGATVSVRGLAGEYRWECLGCDAVGIGYNTRSAALEGVAGESDRPT